MGTHGCLYSAGRQYKAVLPRTSRFLQQKLTAENGRALDVGQLFDVKCKLWPPSTSTSTLHDLGHGVWNFRVLYKAGKTRTENSDDKDEMTILVPTVTSTLIGRL